MSSQSERCISCGTQIPGDSAFCHSCGAAVTRAGGSRSLQRLLLFAVPLLVVVAAALALVLLAQPFSGSDDTAPGAHMVGGNPARTGEYPGPGPQGDPNLLWSFQTGGDTYSSPAQASGLVYVSGGGGNLYALDSGTGEERWRFQANKDLFSPTIVGGVVYVGGGNHVYSLDAATGNERWRFVTDGDDWVFYSPAVVDGVIYVGGDELYAIDAATGEKRWRLKWDGIISSPAVLNHVVYVSACGHESYVYALDAATGEERWRFQLIGCGFPSSPAVLNGTVYVPSGGALYALDAVTGEERWRFQTDETNDIELSSPAVVGGVIYVDGGSLFSLDAATGEERWRFHTDGSSQLAVANGVIYMGIGENQACAFDAVKGEEEWCFRTRGPVSSSPAVRDNVVYVTDEAGDLYAIGGTR